MNKSGFVLFSQNLVNGLASVFKSLISGRRGQLENEGVRACVCVYLNYWGVMQKFNISTRHGKI